MTKLHRLFAEQGQSPWLDNMTRAYVRDGTLARFIGASIRGVTTNPTILAKAIENSDAYDEQLAALAVSVATASDAYWDLVTADVAAALACLRPTFDASAGLDGFVSIEVDPGWAHDTDATLRAARDPDTMYVDSLIGPGTINTLPEATIAVFEDPGTIARTIDRDVDNANAVLNRVAHVGIDMESVGITLEGRGVASFRESFAHVHDAVGAELAELRRH